jgi:hypothetical protein
MHYFRYKFWKSQCTVFHDGESSSKETGRLARCKRERRTHACATASWCIRWPLGSSLRLINHLLYSLFWKKIPWMPGPKPCPCDPTFTAPGTLTPRTARLRLLLSSPHCRSKPLHSLVIWDSAAAVASVLHFCNCRQLDRLSTAGSWTLLQLRHPPSPLRPMPVDLFYWSLCCRPHRTYTVAAGFIPRRTTAAKLFKWNNRQSKTRTYF